MLCSSGNEASSEYPAININIFQRISTKMNYFYLFSYFFVLNILLCTNLKTSQQENVVFYSSSWRLFVSETDFNMFVMQKYEDYKSRS